MIAGFMIAAFMSPQQSKRPRRKASVAFRVSGESFRGGQFKLRPLSVRLSFSQKCLRLCP
jgi:hypothetical protein